MKMTVSLTNLTAHLVGMERNYLSFNHYISQLLTGSYSNFFGVYDTASKTQTILQADKSAFKAKRVGSTKNKILGKTGKNQRKEEYMNADGLDLARKILHASWHPKENTVALAATNNLFLFSQVG
jgi:serine/threonine-protein phosphatase 2A regulatory subunit B